MPGTMTKTAFPDFAQLAFDAAKIGMWLFLATEILMFGGLFVGFALQQSAHPEAFLEAHHHLDKRLGALNTVVLVTFSAAFLWASRGVHDLFLDGRKPTGEEWKLRLLDLVMHGLRAPRP